MEYQDDVALLVESLNEYKKAVNMINDESKFAGSMQREFANRANTTANNLQLLKNSLAEVGMNLGSVLLPPLNAIVKMLISGQENVLGRFVITQIEESQNTFLADVAPRKIEFRLSLERYGEE